jgi:type VI secretion system secreted protein VgrG
MASFDLALPDLLHHEGGLCDVKNDPGGITNMGISLRFLQQEGIDLDGDGKPTADDIRQLTHDQAAEIYRKYFWDRYGYEQIQDQRLAGKIFDMTVNMGPHQSHLNVQRALQSLGKAVQADGAMGPKSFEALGQVDPNVALKAICDTQAGFYIRLVEHKPDMRKFLAGWLKRAGWPVK